MFFIVWSGFGLLVPVVAVASYMFGGVLFGQLPQNWTMILSSILASAALVAAGMFLRNKGVRRHLYWIPMEYWSVATAIMGMSYIPKLFGA